MLTIASGSRKTRRRWLPTAQCSGAGRRIVLQTVRTIAHAPTSSSAQTEHDVECPRRRSRHPSAVGRPPSACGWCCRSRRCGRRRTRAACPGCRRSARPDAQHFVAEGEMLRRDQEIRGSPADDVQRGDEGEHRDLARPLAAGRVSGLRSRRHRPTGGSDSTIATRRTLLPRPIVQGVCRNVLEHFAAGFGVRRACEPHFDP